MCSTTQVPHTWDMRVLLHHRDFAANLTPMSVLMTVIVNIKSLKPTQKCKGRET